MFLRILFGAAALFLSAFWSETACARFGDISKEDIEFFLDESYAGDESDGDQDWEDFLYRAAEQGKTPSKTIQFFSEKIGATEADAAVIADAIIEITRFDAFCPSNRVPKYDCRFVEGVGAFDKFIAANAVDLTGELAFVIGKNVGSRYDPEDWRKAYVEVVVTHPGRTLTFQRLLAYSRDDLWIFALAAAGELDPTSAGLIFLRAYNGAAYESPSWDGGLLALIEALLERPNLDSETRALLSFAQISLELRVGLEDAAIASYRLLPSTITNYAPPKDPPEKKYREEQLTTNFIEFKIDLAAAFLQEGRVSSASRHLDEAKAGIGGEEALRGRIATRLAIMDELLSQKINKDQVFDYFVYGYLPGTKPPKLERTDMHGTNGWLFEAEDCAPAFRNVTSAYLRRRGFDGMANYLDDRRLYYRSGRKDELIDTLFPLLPAAFASRKEYWRGRVDYAWNKHEARKSSSDSGLISEANRPLTPPQHFVEAALPEKLQTKEGDPDFSKRNESDVPPEFEAPVSEWQIVRYAEENGERQLIFISSALDAPGEIPAYGYWFQQTRENGAAWDEPIYLGLIQYFPYVVIARSKMPLLSEGGLTIEVDAKEIDPETISFPPVGLGLKREERNLYLSIKFDDIMRDSDSDGITDLVERRLQMNPKSADTDGDGLEDARDPLPLTKFDPDAPAARRELAYALLSKIAGYDRGAIMVAPGDGGGGLEDVLAAMGAAAKAPKISDGALFLRADPEIFAGVRTPFRLFVFSDEAVERIRAEGAPFYPVGISALFSRPNGLEHYVIWSAGWVGGEFIVRCDVDNKCTTEVVSEWIT